MKKIMIIGNRKLNQLKIENALSELGYQVLNSFDSGKKAVDYILKGDNQPDLIITDILLNGEMNGYQVASKISLEKNIPFIFTFSQLEEIKDGFEASVYLNKSFNKQELLNNIELALYKYDIYKKKLSKKNVVDSLVSSVEESTDYKKTENIIKDLHKIAINFKALESEKEICKMTIKAAEDLLEFNLCNVLLSHKEKFVTIASSSDYKQKEHLISEKSIAAKTYNEGKCFIIDDLQNNPDALPIENIYKSAMSIPIGKYGVFQAAAPDKNHFTEKDLELADILIAHTKAALDRVYAQEKIKEQKDYLDTILNTIPEIIILLDSKGNYLNILTSNTDDLIDNKDKLIGKNVKAILPKNVADEYLKFCKKVNQDGKSKSFDYQLNINGEEKYFDVIFSPIDSKDKIGDFIVATIRNITKLTTRKNALEEQKIYFEQLFNNSTEGIVLLDNKHHVLKINKKFKSLFGFKESELMNKNLDDFILPAEFKIKGKKYTEKVRRGEKIEGESIRKTKSGEKINVYLQGFPINLPDGKVGIYALYKDITERKKKEKQVEYLSFHDEMTGLYNRRYFENELKRLESSRKHPIAIIIGDLDGLKM